MTMKGFSKLMNYFLENFISFVLEEQKMRKEA